MGNRVNRARRPFVVRELYGIGIGAPEIADLTGWSHSTIDNDVRRLGGSKAFPSRPKKGLRGLVFANALKCYARIACAFNCNENSLSDDENAIRLALAEWLREDKVLFAILGILSTLAHLCVPSYSATNRARARLLGAVCGTQILLDELLPMSLSMPRELWHQYLATLNSTDDANVPRYYDQLVGELSRFALDDHRARIMPIWGDEVFARLDEMLRELNEHQRLVVCSRFGIGMDKPKIHEKIAVELGVTRDRVRQLEARAIYNLRAAIAEHDLGMISEPVGDALERELMRRKIAQQVAEATTQEWEQNLFTQVENLALFSMRLSNILRNAGILLVGELVQKSEPELLRTKNFSRKMLIELREVLDELELQIGMQISDELKAAIARRKEEILSSRGLR